MTANGEWVCSKCKKTMHLIRVEAARTLFLCSWCLTQVHAEEKKAQ
jgi:DNA-directed RNA polymerase subunit RPC12/RpoP